MLQTTLLTRRAASALQKSQNINLHVSTRLQSSSQSACDRLVVVGTGVAGSAAALVAAERHQIPVTLLCAGSAPTDCNSYWAQGGIIYRNYSPTSNDSAALLAQDVHKAGAGLCDANAVKKVALEGPNRVKELLLDKTGVFAQVPFERCDETGELKLTLEASHAAPRILYYADHTGKQITQHLVEAAAKHPLITIQSDTVVTDLIVENGHCVGVTTLVGGNDNDALQHASSQQQHLLASRGVVLASGGLAGIYQHSTNPPGFNALGSSVGLARRANVATRDLEYVQFHPTALYIPHEARFLLTEALRGEGAILRNCHGHAFATNFHADGELAPRDIVARGVFSEAQQTRGNVYLDISHRDRDWLYGRFPTIHAHLQQRNLDMAKDPLPITPAAHYTCGGIDSDLNGCTSLPGLYAAGEAARTGLHGGNRLASTSLLEGLVFGASIADYIGAGQGRDVASEARILLEQKQQQQLSSHPNSNGAATSSSNHAAPSPAANELLDHLKKTMWNHVGVVRTEAGLQTAIHVLDDIKDHAEAIYQAHPSRQTAGLRDAAFAGQAVAQAAAANRVSAGAHCIVLENDDQDGSSSGSDDDDEEEEEEEELLAAAAR